MPQPPIRIGKASFRLWLSSHDPNAIVGYVGQPASCPLAMFLHAKRDHLSPRHNDLDVRVYGNFIDSYIPYTSPSTVMRSTFKWERHFQMLMDHHVSIGTPITALQALTALNSIQ